ncbi:MAG TPA: ceramidase domain-containing protein [Pseudolabrys sp.]|nr:ceramidase domain-containing protein [Pseudolabrys sp.]
MATPEAVSIWSTPIDLYCERTDASFWSEPVNAVSNAAFLIAAFVAYRMWRQRGRRDLATLALIGVVVLVGLGSFTFHTVATRGAMLLDVGPIGLFIYGYFLLALRRFLRLPWLVSVAGLIGFVVLSTALADRVPREFLNGSSGYFPALAALIVIGALTRSTPWGKVLLLAAVIFILSLVLRIIDLDICNAVPLGTHFLWHICNAIVLYLALRGAIAERSANAA